LSVALPIFDQFISAPGYVLDLDILLRYHANLLRAFLNFEPRALSPRLGPCAWFREARPLKSYTERRGGGPAGRHGGIAAFHRIHRFDKLIVAAGRQYGVDPRLVSALIWRESGFGNIASGARGEIGLCR
jgi:hypothetical protein